MEKELQDIVLYVGGLIGGGYASKAALTKIADVVAKGAGIIIKRIETNDELVAKAKEKIMLAEADVISDYVKEKGAIVSPKLQSIINNYDRQLESISDVVSRSTKYLSNDVSNDSVDTDWSIKFFNTIKDITSDELREVWAKVLAGEVNKPGAVGLRTLDILKNVNQQEAQLFLKFASLATPQGVIFKYDGDDFTEVGITYGEMLLMREAGLLISGEALRIKYKQVVKLSDEKPAGTYQIYGNKVLYIGSVGEKPILISNIALTKAGVELMAISKFDTNYEYLEKVKESLNKLEYYCEIFDKKSFVFQKL